MPKTITSRTQWFVFYHKADRLIWQNRLFPSTIEAQRELDEFFGFKNAYRGIRVGGWKLRKVTLTFKIIDDDLTD